MHSGLLQEQCDSSFIQHVFSAYKGLLLTRISETSFECSRAEISGVKNICPLCYNDYTSYTRASVEYHIVERKQKKCVFFLV